jgi:zinc D-Ala-D-Ala carboxypeptidase
MKPLNNNDMNLSKNLTLDEATKSATALRKGIDNTPTPAIIETMKLTAEKVFQPLRDKVGPIIVSSFYRCPDLNRAIGGSTSSQHMKGEAIDMSGVNVSNAELFEEALKLEQFDQLIWEFGTDKNPAWIHISYSKTHNRKQVLVATKSRNGTAYKPYKKR